MKGRSWFLYSLLISLFFLLLFPIHYEARSVKDCMEEDVDCLKQWHGDAEQIDEKTQEDKKTSLDRLKKDSMFFNVLKVFFALLFILLLIYLAIRFLNNRHLSTAQRKVMENLGGISLGQNKSVQVIRVGEKVYLLGVGENVELLKEISDQNLIDELIHKNDQNFDTKSFL